MYHIIRVFKFYGGYVAIENAIKNVQLCYFSTKSFGQAPGTSNIENFLHYILRPLFKSQVPTGFLKEYGAPMLPPATFNGILTDKKLIDT